MHTEMYAGCADASAVTLLSDIAMYLGAIVNRIADVESRNGIKKPQPNMTVRIQDYTAFGWICVEGAKTQRIQVFRAMEGAG